MSPEQNISSGDIAVVGMSGRLPGAANLDEFWVNLCEGREGIRFLTDHELLQHGVSPDLVAAHDYVKAAADLSGVKYFDHAFFGFTPRDAKLMDPQLRLLLECAWATIEHAGYSPEDYRGAIGVFAGAAPNSYFIENLLPNRALMQSLHGPLSPLEIFTASDALSTMVSFKLNLRGPSLTIQTACSTSLVAVHLACQSLLSHESDMALAGGVNLSIPQERGYLYQKGMILSPDGHCRPFDADAAGTLFGGGVGFVLLKRLTNALAHRDTIHAVIKGSAVNNDGAAKVGYTAPSVAGQAEVVALAQAMAGHAAAILENAQLVDALRASEKWKSMPVIVFSAQDLDEGQRAHRLDLRQVGRLGAARLAARPPHPASAKLTAFAKAPHPSPTRGEGARLPAGDCCGYCACLFSRCGRAFGRQVDGNAASVPFPRIGMRARPAP